MERHPYERERKLTAIMFTDIQNFSKIMGDDEDQALHILDRHKEILLPIITDFEGSILKFMGDGILVEFKSGVQAVRCGMKIQDMLKTHNKGLQKPKKIFLRIGIHIGDVVVVDEDIYGDGVNIAARLQPLAEPGGVCISQAVYDVVQNRVEVQTISLGERELKNIKNAVGIYKVVVDAQRINGDSDDEATGGLSPKRVSRRRKLIANPLWYVSGFLIVLLMLFFQEEIKSLFTGTNYPVRIEFEGANIHAINDEEKILWTYTLEHEIVTTKIAGTDKKKPLAIYEVTDIDGDGKKEIVAGIKTTAEASKSANVYCFSQDGELLWKNKVGKKTTWGKASRVIEDNFNIRHLLIYDVNHDGYSEIFVISNQSPWFPSILTVFTKDGAKTGEWLNSGHINVIAINDLDNDGVDEIFVGGSLNVGGLNNSGFLAVFEYEKIHGQGFPRRNCNDFDVGTEKYYVVFPRFSFAKNYAQRGHVYEIKFLGDKIEVRAMDGKHDPLRHRQELTYFFTFDFDMNFLNPGYGDAALTFMKKLIRDGVITNTTEEEYERLSNVKYWDGEKLQDEVCVNKNWVKVK